MRLVSAEVVGDACPRCGAALIVEGTAELARLRKPERRAEPRVEIEWRSCPDCGYHCAKRLQMGRRH